MNNQMMNIGRKLLMADMKKILGGRGGSGLKCFPYDGPCITHYIPGGQDCCKTCCNDRCLARQQADPPCSGVIIDPEEGEYA